MDSEQIKVLIVDDSLFMRRMLSRMASTYAVVFEASNGLDALTKIPEVKPDVVLLDIEMPVMDGLETLREIMKRHPLPVVCISGSTRYGAGLTLSCLELGAVDFIVKPNQSNAEGITAMADAVKRRVITASKTRVRQPGAQKAVAPKKEPVKSKRLADQIVVIASSTGGPTALQEVLTKLPSNLRAAVLVVQHMPPVFTGAMAQRLDGMCAVSVREAAAGDTLEDGTVLIAPGGRHMRLDSNRKIVLNDDPPLYGVRPAADYLLSDAAARFNTNVLGVVLTGMGSDGTKGLGNIKSKGGTTIAQDEQTSLIFGMPRAAIEAGVADIVLPLPSIGNEITRWCTRGGGNK